MERVWPAARLGVLISVFCVNLVTFLALLWAAIFKISFRARVWYIAALLFKLAFDLVPIIFGALGHANIRLLDDGRARIIDYILLCLSFICVTSLELFLLWNVHDRAAETGLGWVIHRPGLVFIIISNLSLFLPLIRYRNESLKFWTCIGIIFTQFLLFGFAYSWILKLLRTSGNRTSGKRTSRLAGCITACLVLALSSSVAFVVGQKVQRAQGLLLEILLLFTTVHLLIRVLVCTTAQVHKEGSRRMTHGAQSDKNERPLTSTSMKPLTGVANHQSCSCDTVALPRSTSPPIYPQPSPSDIIAPDVTDFAIEWTSQGENEISTKYYSRTQWPLLDGSTEATRFGRVLLEVKEA